MNKPTYSNHNDISRKLNVTGYLTIKIIRVKKNGEVLKKVDYQKKYEIQYEFNVRVRD